MDNYNRAAHPADKESCTQKRLRLTENLKGKMNSRTKYHAITIRIRLNKNRAEALSSQLYTCMTYV